MTPRIVDWIVSIVFAAAVAVLWLLLPFPNGGGGAG